MASAQHRPSLRVLVAEDQAIVALALQDELDAAGFEVIGPFATCAAVARWLLTATPDLAILDAELQDGPCVDVAHELNKRGVEFVVFSGSIRHELPAILAEAPWYEKPADLHGLVATLRGRAGR